MVYDQRIVMQPSGGAPPASPGIASTVRRTPFLSLIPAPAGGSVQLDFDSPPGQLVILCVGLPSPPTTVVGANGESWLALTSIAVVTIGTQAANGHFVRFVGLPNDPGLRGFTLGWQGVSSDGVTVDIGTPAIAPVQ